MTVLNIFDLDDTLFNTPAQGYLVKADGTREKIARGSYHNIVPGIGEHIEYDEFRSVEYFINHNRPIYTVHTFWATLRALGEDCIILTARGRMDNVAWLQQYLRTTYEIDGTVHFSGDLAFDNTKDAKKYCIKKILSVPSLNYTTVRFIDDHAANLDGFMELSKKDDFKHILFSAFLAKNGTFEPYETPTAR